MQRAHEDRAEDLAFATLRWPLEQPCWIEGTVTDRAGQPAPGASIYTMFLEQNATRPEPPAMPPRADKSVAAFWPELEANELRYLIARVTERRLARSGDAISGLMTLS